MKKIGLILLLLGIGLNFYSRILPAYTDNGNFYSTTYSLKDKPNSIQEYRNLRNFYLTNKYILEDYSLTTFILGLYILILAPKKNQNLKSPKKKRFIFLIGFLASILTIVAYIAMLFIDGKRWTDPPWFDDSTGIILGIPFAFLFLIAWSGLNLIILDESFRTSVPINELRIKPTNYWYLSLLLISAILIVISIFTGAFLFTATGLLWAYFYLSLLLGSQNKITNTNNI